MKTRLFWLSLLTIFLIGCQQIKEKRTHYVRDQSKDYVNAHLIAPLKVPEDFTTPTSGENYPIPENLPKKGHTPKVDMQPPGFGQLNKA